MAVDYFHFLVVSGPRPAVQDFVHRIALVVDRRVAGVRTRHTVPFSFQSMWNMAAMKGNVPYDPYDMARWPISRHGKPAEARYRFHTRSLELHPLLKRLSRATPKLTYALVTWCLDDGDFGPFTIKNGRLRGQWLGGEWREPFWARAAKQFKMPLDETYDDPVAEQTAEGWMRDAAMQIATGTSRRHDWSGGRTFRDLDDERESAMLEFARAFTRLEEGEARARPSRKLGNAGPTRAVRVRPTR